MDINRKSHVFQEAGPSLIQKIFTEKLHTGPRLETELISGGLFNTAYKASCGGQEYVIRFGPVNQHLLMGFEKNLMEAEAYVYGLCRKHQITCPRVLARTPHLLHTDLWEGNVIIAFEGGKPYLKTVIDADRAVFGDEDFEWAAPWMDMPGIRRGAGIREETFLKPDRQMRRQIYRVFYALTGCYAGIYEYEDMDMYQSGKKEAVQAAGLALHDAGTE